MTDHFPHEQRRLEREAKTMAGYSEPDSCHWRVSGPPAEISNTPAYQALCSQAIHEQIRLLSWNHFISDLLFAQKSLKAAGLPGPDKEEQAKLAVGIAHGMDAGIASAVAKRDGIKVEIERLDVEKQRIVDEFYRRS